MMAEHDGLVFYLCGLAIFPGQHVDFALIHSELTDICFQEKDVGALHEGIQDLRSREISFQSAHYLTTLFDPGYVESSRYVQHSWPVGVSMLGYFL
jgi:hypothetical protein